MAKRRHLVLPHSSVKGKKPSVYNAETAPAGVMKSELAINISDGNEFLSTQNESGNIKTWWALLEKGEKNNTYVDGTIVASNGSLQINNKNEIALGVNNESVQEETEDATEWNNNSGSTLFSIGNGTSSSEPSNAFEIRRDGTTFIKGSLNVLSDGEYVDVLKTISEDEMVTAAALNDLNEKIDEVANDIDAELDTESPKPVANSAITTYLETKEEVIAAALNDLNDKIEYVAHDIDEELNVESKKAVTNEAISKQFEKVEKVTAEALNDLNSRIIEHSENGNIHVSNEEKATWNGKQDPITIDTELSFISDNPIANSAVTKAIDDSEKVTSAALNDLNDRLGELGNAGRVLPITDASTLESGQLGFNSSNNTLYLNMGSTIITFTGTTA